MSPVNKDLLGQTSILVTIYTDVTIGERFPSCLVVVLSECWVERRWQLHNIIKPHLKLPVLLCSLSDPGDTVDNVTMQLIRCCCHLLLPPPASLFPVIGASICSLLMFILIYPPGGWCLISCSGDYPACDARVPVLMTISMIGAGAASSRTDQIITNNKHSLGRN